MKNRIKSFIFIITTYFNSQSSFFHLKLQVKEFFIILETWTFKILDHNTYHFTFS